eukprot:2327911-Rhodomonas_salina.1
MRLISVDFSNFIHGLWNHYPHEAMDPVDLHRDADRTATALEGLIISLESTGSFFGAAKSTKKI